jgi:hypothetical protein
MNDGSASRGWGWKRNIHLGNQDEDDSVGAQCRAHCVHSARPNLCHRWRATSARRPSARLTSSGPSALEPRMSCAAITILIWVVTNRCSALLSAQWSCQIHLVSFVLRVRSKKRTRTNWIHFSHRLEKNNPTRGKEMKDALLTEAEAAGRRLHSWLRQRVRRQCRAEAVSGPRQRPSRGGVEWRPHSWLRRGRAEVKIFWRCLQDFRMEVAGFRWWVWVRLLVMIVASGRTKLSVFLVNSMTSSCWPKNYLDLMLNPTVETG